jgi:predicted SprT family Zn-dependent metalloprotease
MRVAERIALRQANLDLFSVDVEECFMAKLRTGVYFPDDADLSRLFADLNHKFFSGRLPDANVEWSSRMKHAGRCSQELNLIRLGLEYHRHYPEDIVDTLKHEMIHLLHPNHGTEFKREARRIGASRYAKQYPGMLKGMRYLYECPTCGESFPSRKLLRMRACGKCSGRKYDSRHKLRFVRRLDQS